MPTSQPEAASVIWHAFGRRLMIQNDTTLGVIFCYDTERHVSAWYRETDWRREARTTEGVRWTQPTVFRYTPGDETAQAPIVATAKPETQPKAKPKVPSAATEMSEDLL